MIDHRRIYVAHDINTKSDQEPLEQVDDFRREQKAGTWAPIKSEKKQDKILLIGPKCIMHPLMNLII